MSTTRHLAIRWSTSRAVDTWGYPICRLTDPLTNRSFRSTGGGYDLTGEVFGEWLECTYQRRLLNHHASQHYGARVSAVGGMPRIRLDGACGLRSMLDIAEHIGLEVTQTYDTKGHCTGFMVFDHQA